MSAGQAKAAAIPHERARTFLSFYDQHIHPYLPVVGRILDYGTHNPTLLYILLFPFLLVLSSIFGGLLVWGTMIALTLHYHIQQTALKKHQLYEKMTFEAQVRPRTIERAAALLTPCRS